MHPARPKALYYLQRLLPRPPISPAQRLQLVRGKRLPMYLRFLICGGLLAGAGAVQARERFLPIVAPVRVGRLRSHHCLRAQPHPARLMPPHNCIRRWMCSLMAEMALPCLHLLRPPLLLCRRRQALALAFRLLLLPQPLFPCRLARARLLLQSRAPLVAASLTCLECWVGR